MSRDEIAVLLDGLLDKEVMSLDKPSPADWETLEQKFECQFPQTFKYFIELLTVYSFPGEVLNVSSGRTNGNDTIGFTYDYEMKQSSWREDFIPFYSIGNGDYFCLLSHDCPNSSVVYYSHEDSSIVTEANDFDEWLHQLPAFLS